MSLKNIDALYTKHYPEIFRFCYGIIKNKQDVEEITNETFVKAYLHYDPTKKTTFRTYIFRIATNLCFDYCKSKQFKQKKITTSIEDAPSVEDSTTTNGKLQHKEILTILYECLDKLKSDEQRISLRLYFIDELVYREIADIINKSINTVKNRIESGLKHLKKCLKKNGIISS